MGKSREWVVTVEGGGGGDEAAALTPSPPPAPQTPPGGRGEGRKLRSTESPPLVQAWGGAEARGHGILATVIQVAFKANLKRSDVAVVFPRKLAELLSDQCRDL